METEAVRDDDVPASWVEIAHGARIASHMLSHVYDPKPGSKFAKLNDTYPYEKASDWHRSYLMAALEHLTLWANVVAPLDFGHHYVVETTLRPTYTLARAAIEASSQAVWMTSGATEHECARRHLALIRWDYHEQQKSVAEPEKKYIKDMDTQLLARVSGDYHEVELTRPNHVQILEASAPVAGLDAARVILVWRAASGAAHGRIWPGTELQHLLAWREYEPGQLRTLRVPDIAKMTEALHIADTLTRYGVLRFSDFSGAATPTLQRDAIAWLASVIPVRSDADPQELERLRRGGSFE